MMVNTYRCGYNGENYSNMVKEEDYLKVVEENELLHQENEKRANDYDELKEENSKLNKFLFGCSGPERWNEFMEENKELERENEKLKISLNNSIKETCERNKELLKQDNQIKELQNICNDIGKEIEELRKKLKEMTRHKDRVFMNVLELEKEIEGMKTLKVCMKCQIKEKETIDKLISKGRFLFVDNCLQEDCEMCEGEDKNKFVEMIEQTNYGFEDSWVLSYKVKGMIEPVIQYHLTEEECYVILGNMNGLTYIHMEVMK